MEQHAVLQSKKAVFAILLHVDHNGASAVGRKQVRLYEMRVVELLQDIVEGATGQNHGCGRGWRNLTLNYTHKHLPLSALLPPSFRRAGMSGVRKVALRIAAASRAMMALSFLWLEPSNISRMY
jgi:hypothetical protein